MGFVSVLGKSGCGKSTLLHCIGTLEKVDSGEITLDYRPIQNLKEKEKRNYLNKTVSFVFQHYQLIEDQTILYNVALPMMIAGEREKFALECARKLLKEVGFSEEKQQKLVNTCSGGEKQRVALCRSMINEPKIILADEPTGALDSKNSEIVMEILKKYSQKHLVIMVTHNEHLANQYSDKVMRLKNNQIEIKTIKEINEKKPIQLEQSKKNKSNNWINAFINKNLKKRFKRNSVSCISLAISLLFTFILFGFMNGSNVEIPNQSIRQFDRGVSSVSITSSTDIENSKMKLIQEKRPTQEDMDELVKKYDFIEFGLNYDKLISCVPLISYKNKELSNLTYNPIYSFSNTYIPDDLIDGKYAKDSLDEVVINRKANEYLTKILGKSPLNISILVKSQLEVTTYLDDPLVPYITDYFIYEKQTKIVGVVDEVTFLSTPKIFYSFIAMDEYMDLYVLNNLSAKLGRDVTYKEKLKSVSSTDPLSSYSYRIFLKDINEFSKIEEIDQSVIKITNNSLTVREAITSFVTAATMGMELFLGIAILGSIFILGITSFSSYSQDQHQNAILLSLGANRDDVFLIYIIESLILGMISFFLSLLLSVVLSPFINFVLNSSIGFSNMVQIPLRKFLGKSFLLPFLIFGITSMVCIFSSYIPMVCSKKVSLSQELKEE